MAGRSGWRRFGLIVALMVVALPVGARERVRERQAEVSIWGEVWAVVVRWVAPSSQVKLGPGMDPNGVTGGTSSPGTSSGGGDLGADMDPDG